MDDLKAKVEPIKTALKKFLGVSIEELEKDITDTLSSHRLIGYNIDTNLTLRQAKIIFKRDFLTKIIQIHAGNISETAKIVGVDRRSLHRDINSLDIDIDQLRHTFYGEAYFKKEAMDSLLRKTLQSYKEVIHPKKLKEVYGELPEISREIADVLPASDMTWKEAEEEFEKEYFSKILKETSSLKECAKRSGLAYETLIRKLKKLNI